MSLLSDARFALRLWRRHPTLIAVATLSLGLGVGATTTMYSVVNRVAHYDLGFKDEDRLAIVWSTDRQNTDNRNVPTYEIVEALQKSGKSFEAFGCFQGGGVPVTLSGTVETVRVNQMPVDVNALSIVGVPPLMGRTYRLSDFDDVVKQKEARSIVITYGTWQKYLGGVPDVIGKTIRVDGEPRTIIGVMPKDFALVPWVDDVAYWAANDLRKVPLARWMIVVGRLKPGVTPAAASAEAEAISRQVLKGHGEKVDTTSAMVRPIRIDYFGDPVRILSFLLGAVSFVLLIGCANVANLLLAAGAARNKELALRAATGASRWRLLKQLFIENLLLSVIGAAVGLLLAFFGTRAFRLLVPDNFPDLLRHISMDVRVLGFALGISVASSLLFGLLPALRASHVDLTEAMKEGSRSVTSGRRRGRNALLVAEVALSMVLLVGAGLMLRGYIGEQRKLPGFNVERMLTADILLGGDKYFSKSERDTNLVTPQADVFYEQLLERVRALPGVNKAAIASRLPMEVWSHQFTIVGKPSQPMAQQPRADFSEIDPQLFDTLGIQLLRGRNVRDTDVASSPWVAVVNKTFADRYFPGQDALGKYIRMSIGWGGQPGTIEEPQQRQIVGIVSDVTYPSYLSQIPGVIYVPYKQHMNEYGSEDEWIHTRKVLAVRTAGDPLALSRSIRDVIKQVDPDQTAHDFMTMEQQVASSGSVTNGRFFASLFTVFGSLAILLAMVGVYGVMSWLVGQRTTEFGIRMALGARAADVVRMMVLQSLRPIALGVVLGAAGGVALSRSLNRMFSGLSSADPFVLGGIAVLMLAAAMAAAWGPLRRVVRLQPQQVLRDQ